MAWRASVTSKQKGESGTEKYGVTPLNGANETPSAVADQPPRHEPSLLSKETVCLLVSAGEGRGSVCTYSVQTYTFYETSKSTKKAFLFSF